MKTNVTLVMMNLIFIGMVLNALMLSVVLRTVLNVMTIMNVVNANTDGLLKKVNVQLV